MRANILTCSVLTFAIVAITGCKSSQQTSVTQPEKKPAASAQTVTRLAADELKHLTGEWSVTAIGDSVLDVELLPVVNLQLPDNKNETNKNILLCYANGGCNTINGQFEVGDNGIIEPSGEFISTMMYCPEPNFDLMLGQAFADVKKYTLTKASGEQTLSLYSSNGKKSMTLRKHDSGFLNGAWRITSINGKPIAADTGMEMVIDLPERRVHMNAGCNIVNATINPMMDTPNGIKFGNMRSTRMTCPNIELEYALLQNLEKVTKCARSGKKSTALLEDASGKVLISMTRMELDENNDLQ